MTLFSLAMQTFMLCWMFPISHFKRYPSSLCPGTIVPRPPRPHPARSPSALLASQVPDLELRLSHMQTMLAYEDTVRLPARLALPAGCRLQVVRFGRLACPAGLPAELTASARGWGQTGEYRCDTRGRTRQQGTARPGRVQSTLLGGTARAQDPGS